MRFQYTINCFADIGTEEALHGVTRKLDLDQTLLAHKHTERQSDKTHFSVRPRDFLHPSPINSALYVVIMLVLVCLCRFLWHIILLTYMSYELVVSFDEGKFCSAKFAKTSLIFFSLFVIFTGVYYCQSLCVWVGEAVCEKYIIVYVYIFYFMFY